MRSRWRSLPAGSIRLLGLSGLAVLAMLAAAAPCAAQGAYRMLIAPFRVERADGGTYLNPFSGGLFQPRIGLRDADRDGLPDLFTLNPDNRLRYYHNEGGLGFRRVWPSPYDDLPLRKWFRFADLDGDGDDDILTSAALAQVLLYRNIGSQSDPRFAEAPDTLRGADGTAISIQQETVPSLVDIDGNGTLDFLAGNPTDGTITFYRNTGTRTDPRFTFVTSRFMEISVISPGATKRRDDGDAGVISGGAVGADDDASSTTQRHGASVLGFGDIDGDADLDLLFGDLFTRKLLLFRNSGSPTDPRFSMSDLDTAFRPNGSDVESEGFNQAEIGDLDRDGDPDVLVSSLHPQSSAQPVILYRNTAPGPAPAMTRQGLDVTSEIDLGTYSSLAPIDDADRHGVLVGTIDGAVVYFATRVEGSATIWKEQGRAILPGIFQVAPAAGDLDGDGHAEIVIGDAEGYLRLYRYQGNVLAQSPWQLDTFKVGQYSSPTLVDLDRDGDLDLFLGGGNGRFVYFENIGTPTAPLFERKTPPEPFNTLDVDNDAAPRFADLDGDGDPDAIVGGRTSSGLGASVDTVRFLLNEGGRFQESPAFPRLLAVRSPVPMLMSAPEGRFLILGNQAGGLAAFTFPTPSGVEREGTACGISGGARLELPSMLRSGEPLPVSWLLPRGEGNLLLMDLLGREAARLHLAGPEGQGTFRLPGLGPGLYFYRLEGAGAERSGRIVVTW